MDANNADVIAMVSRPNFDPLHVNLAAGNWMNHALKAIVPGSIFKTVVAAAALDEHAVNLQEKFECTGSLGQYGFFCWKKDGHGEINLAEAYAESCNITFAKVMRRIPSDTLVHYAQMLGLDRKIGWSDPFANSGEGFTQFDNESSGQIFSPHTPIHDDGVRIQTAIGQRDVLVTPLQAANMVVTLVNHGNFKSPRVIREVDYQNNQVMMRFPVHELNSDAEHISAQTSSLLLQWMRKVVTEGTGKALMQAKWEVAGKSGTAQIAYHQINKWFIGYGPYDKPKYAVAVVAENMPENSKKNIAIQVFKNVMDELASM